MERPIIYLFQDASNSKDSWWRNFFLIPSNGVQEVLSSVIKAILYITKPLCICRPQNNHLRNENKAM